MVFLSPYSSVVTPKPTQPRQNTFSSGQAFVKGPRFAGPTLEELDTIDLKQRGIETKNQNRYHAQMEKLQELLPQLEALARTNSQTQRRITAMEVTRVVAEKSGIVAHSPASDLSPEILAKQILDRKKAAEEILKQQQQDKSLFGFFDRLLSPQQNISHQTPVPLNLRSRYQKPELADFQTIAYQLIKLGILKRTQHAEHFNINDISLTPLGKAYLDSQNDA